MVGAHQREEIEVADFAGQDEAEDLPPPILELLVALRPAGKDDVHFFRNGALAHEVAVPRIILCMAGETGLPPHPFGGRHQRVDRKSKRLKSRHYCASRSPYSA